MTHLSSKVNFYLRFRYKKLYINDISENQNKAFMFSNIIFPFDEYKG